MNAIPRRVRVYIAVLSIVAIAVLAYTARSGGGWQRHVEVWAFLVALYVATELGLSLFHHREGRVGLSAAEAVLLPMIVVSTVTQLVWGVAIGAAIVSAAHRSLGVAKAIFNVAQFTCAALPAALIWRTYQDPAVGFSGRDSLAAVGAVVVFAILTHLFVASAIAASEGSSVLKSSSKVARATMLNLAGNICVGLMLAAASAGNQWTVILFVFPLGALILGYRAVLKQLGDRGRIAKLHEATRALAANPELDRAADGFLRATREMLSASHAFVTISGEVPLVYESSGITDAGRITERATIRVAAEIAERGTRLVVAGTSGNAGALADELGLHDLVAVPLWQNGKVAGCLAVTGRRGAGAFGDDDARLLEALGNELQMAVQSRRRQAEAERQKEILETQLHQAQKLESVGQLAGGIAHDFNNLLSVILNCSSFAMTQVDENDPVAEDLGEIRRAAQRAADLTRQLLIFSRRDVVRPEVIDLNDSVAGVERLLRRAVGENIEIRMHLGSKLASIKADPGQIEQVLLNLAVNARDSMPGGGKLQIETGNTTLVVGSEALRFDVQAGEYVRLTVADTGTGMAQEVIERAFEPFFTTKPKGIGTGLGLATVYGIARHAGGGVSIESEEGVGTTIVLVFPAVKQASSKVEVVETRKPDRAEGETILLVEDEAAVRAVASRILRAHGYAVLEAEDGLEALTRLDSAPDLLLTDIVMPGISGFELAQQLRSRLPKCPIVFMSGYSDALVDGGSLVTQDAALLQKPFDENDLLETIRGALVGVKG